MVSMFSNWHKIQFHVLRWDSEARKLTIHNGQDPNSTEYHERFGELVFDEDFNHYMWTDENKYGDQDDLSVW